MIARQWSTNKFIGGGMALVWTALTAAVLAIIFAKGLLDLVLYNRQVTQLMKDLWTGPAHIRRSDAEQNATTAAGINRLVRYGIPSLILSVLVIVYQIYAAIPTVGEETTQFDPNNPSEITGVLVFRIAQLLCEVLAIGYSWLPSPTTITSGKSFGSTLGSGTAQPQEVN